MSDSGWLEATERAYDANPEREWRRLQVRPQDRIEYFVTTHVLGEVFGPRGNLRVLDAGGGPGRYSIDLARKGHRVTLLDLSQSNIAFARAQIAAAEAPVSANVEGTFAASFTSMPYLRDHSFDAVLCGGGAISHVIDLGARHSALCEFRRVAAPGAPVVVSFGNRLSGLRGAVQWPDSWATGMASVVSGEPVPLENGAPYQEFFPEEVAPQLEGAGLTVERIYGCQGIAAHLHYERLEATMSDPERWPVWSQWLLKTAHHPNILGLSCHLIAVARST